jgi:hypothetical protein
MHDISVFKQMLSGRLFVSGHMYYHDWLRFTGDLNSEFIKITLVRHPLDHLKSHLLFLKSQCTPELRGGYKTIDQVLCELDLVDFSDPLNINNFIDSLPPIGVELFDNCQSRYFLCTKLNDPQVSLGVRHETLLLSILPQFDLIGLNENMAFFMTEVERLSGISLNIHHELINKTESNWDIDLNNEFVRKAFRRHSEVDEFLYTKILQRTVDASYARVAELQSRAAIADARASEAERQVSELRTQLSYSGDQVQTQCCATRHPSRRGRSFKG